MPEVTINYPKSDFPRGFVDKLLRVLDNSNEVQCSLNGYNLKRIIFNNKIRTLQLIDKLRKSSNSKPQEIEAAKERLKTLDELNSEYYAIIK